MAVLEGYEDLGEFDDGDFVDMDGGDEYVEPAGDEPAGETNALDTEVDNEPVGEADSAETTGIPEGYEWMQGLNPEHVRNSWEKFTQGQQELAAERARLQPYEELYGELTSNEALQNHIRAFYENGGQPTTQVPTGFDPKVVEIENELRILQTERQVEKDWAELQGLIAKNGYPETTQDKVVQYMIDNQIPNMKAAYRDMTYDTVRTKTEERTLENIKKNKAAALPKTPKADSKGTAPTTMDDIMDDDKFFKEYGSVVRGLVG